MTDIPTYTAKPDDLTGVLEGSIKNDLSTCMTQWIAMGGEAKMQLIREIREISGVLWHPNRIMGRPIWSAPQDIEKNEIRLMNGDHAVARIFLDLEEVKRQELKREIKNEAINKVYEYCAPGGSDVAKYRGRLNIAYRNGIEDATDIMSSDGGGIIHLRGPKGK